MTKLKAELPGPIVPRSRRPKWPLVSAITFFATWSAWLCLFAPSPSLPLSERRIRQHSADSEMCVQTSPLIPQKNGSLWNNLTTLHATDDFLARAISQLSVAVQIPTETFDAMGPIGEDARWQSRGSFVDHLEKSFQLLHSTLALEKVNTYGLLYTWQGSDSTLKPILLMGHYDVVPVASSSVDQWTHPPYSGHFDGEAIWGRGSLDDKAGVIGMMMAIEVLLEHKFTPSRTIILSFGFDEEAGGYQGAGHLAPALLDRFGPNSLAMIVDEGHGYSERYGSVFAVPGIAEKGSVNVEIEVQTPGGHSSVPPEHTSIGILAAIIVHLESHAPKSTLQIDTPVFEMAQCFAAHGSTMPPAIKRSIGRARGSIKDLKAAEEHLVQDRMFRALVETTQAVDIISGGVKSNALPEQAQTVVNHRIATQSSVNATLSRDTKLVMDLARKFNLSVTAYGELLTPPGSTYGSVALRAPQSLDPAPVSPISAPPFRVLAGSIRTARNTAAGGRGGGVRCAGALTALLDTRFYWPLSAHIFRYGHRNLLDGTLGGIHTVNERMSQVRFLPFSSGADSELMRADVRADAFVEIITYFTALILNADEAEL
ncbi:Carboxypeptidase S [Mycena venus]|uniref:Carboxypeptidase S n=1 Tax=Mycena venus TaxID=2733690 RepID=A0A8H6Y9J3_9AGAR|nr:Carboxypeptidase S [Mycena venus]